MKVPGLICVAMGLLMINGHTILSAGNDAKKKSIAAELKRLEGTWIALVFERNGRKATLDVKYVFKGNKYKVIFKGKEFGGITFVIDPTKKPKTIDTAFKGNAETVKRHGIYELENDKLKLALVAAGRQRPKEFKSSPDSGIRVWVFKRKK